MLLAIDVGNTNTVFALYKNNTALAQWRTATSTARTADEYAPWLRQLMDMAGLNFSEITACIISTVVPQSLFHLRNMSRRYIGEDPYIIDAKNIPGIEVRIPKPSEAGADRLVTAIGAYKKYGGPLIIVDSGTATTFDIIGRDGGFEGGVIAPGINLSMQALHDAAARLPKIAIEQPGKIIGTDTVGAMKTGIFWGYVALIEGLIDRIKTEYDDEMRVIATGGISSLFENITKSIDVFDSDLTITGLLEIFNRLKK